MSKILFTFFLSLSLFAGPFAHNHDAWNTILSKFVSYNGFNSTFDYAALKKSGEFNNLKTYLKSVNDLSKTEFEKFSDKQKIALLINLFNASTIFHVTENYPIKTINDLNSGLFGVVFSDTWEKLKVCF